MNYALRLIMLLLLGPVALFSQSVVMTVDLQDRRQVIDGFGAHQGNQEVNQNWWKDLYFTDLQASIYRVDLTPKLVSPYSDLQVYSPWFMGSSTDHVFNLEDPDNPDGPEGNRVRTYTGPNDYSRTFGGRNAPIAVMGPDIEANIAYFPYRADGAIAEGLQRREALGDFKLIGSLWSPLPWVKISSGNSWDQSWWPGPVQGTPWPFIWGGNYAGGRLDVSDTPLEIFNDAALGGTGPTSSLTQFARSTAAYIKGYQDFHQVRFYAISIQNELNFEQFYNSASYPLSSQYIAALKALRRELDRYDDLRDIRIMGPEDLLGNGPYGMWQYGGNSDPTHKNLQYLKHLADDPEAMDMIDFFCIHGYDASGVNASGAASQSWDWWVNGWNDSPAEGLPGNVQGFVHYEKKSWMTETSGEDPAWLWPANGYPGEGAWSIAVRIHQALTVGQQSAWIYWTFTEEGDNGQTTRFALTNRSLGTSSPKYVAAKHFFRYIRPHAYRVGTSSPDDDPVLGSAYVHDSDGTVTVVLINTSNIDQMREIQIPGLQTGNSSFEQYTSSDGQYWQSANGNFSNRTTQINLPAYSVVTLYSTDAISTGLFAPGAAEEAPFRLFQNSPNPCSGQTTISYELDQSGFIHLQLLDTKGRTVRTLQEGWQVAGRHERTVDLRGLPTALYYCRLNTAGYHKTQKVIVVNQ